MTCNDVGVLAITSPTVPPISGSTSNDDPAAVAWEEDGPGRDDDSPDAVSVIEASAERSAGETARKADGRNAGSSREPWGV